MPLSAASSALLLVLFVGLPWASAKSHKSGQALQLPRRAVYLSALVTQLIGVVLLLLVLWVDQDSLATIGVVALAPAAVAGWTGAVLAAGFVVGGAIWLVRRATGWPESATLRHLVPRTRDEHLTFSVLLSPTVGFAEEALFRGFAIHRLAPLVGGEWTAAIVAAVAFAISHFYQDALGIARAGILGFVLAVPYVVTGSLLPSMLAHALIDALSASVFGHFLLDGGDPGEPAAV